MSTWVKFADRMPDGPFWAYAAETKQTHCFRCPHEMKRAEPLWTYYTHWQPMLATPEPPKEETQAERDEAACYSSWESQEWKDIDRPIPSDYYRLSWHAALAWERAEVAKMLPTHCEFIGGISYASVWQRICDIRARCNGGAS
jgi:hypothetical protein